MKANNAIGRALPIQFFPMLSLMGPGLLVMLADTDAGSLIFSAQCGASWGYKLIGLQILLVPVLYIVQELAVRLGLATGMGHGELIKHYYGKAWAWFSIVTLVLCCMGALLTEFSGLVAVGALFQVSSTKTMCATIGFLIVAAWTGSYRSIERIAIVLGSFELIFLVFAWKVRPGPQEVFSAASHLPWKDPSFLYLMGSTIGAVIMPWMVFFQQSAVLDKGLTVAHLPHARFDTAVGAVVTQLIMVSVLIIMAKAIGPQQTAAVPLQTVGDMGRTMVPILGAGLGKILFALGISGAALVATIVVSLTAAWGVGEVLNYRRSLEDRPLEAPWFYGIYSVILIVSAWLVCTNDHLVELNIAIEMMNTLLLPIVLGFLFLLSRHALPEKYRLKKAGAWFVGTLFLLTVSFGIITGSLGVLSST